MNFRVAVLCIFPFPEGMAATTRIIAYMKGLTELGCKTDVFVYQPSERFDDISKYPVHGKFSGIEYHYPGSRKYAEYKILRVLGKYYYHFQTCLNIIRENKLHKIDYLLISNDYMLVLFIYGLLGRILGIDTIFVTDEYPEPMRTKLKPDICRCKKMAYHFLLKNVCGMVFMTSALCDFYNMIITKPSHIMPTITDTERFIKSAAKFPSGNSVKHLCYMGNMELAKDNIDNIIIAFSKIIDKYPELKLDLYGTPGTEDRTVIEKLIHELKLSEHVFFKGRIMFEQVPSVLHCAHILVASQPKTQRAQGGFPTKLGEYMATGVPAIFTDVGEISQYVKDRVHVNIVPPMDPEAYAERLQWILDHYSDALVMAQNARRLVCEKYNYKTVAKNLMEFLSSLHEERHSTYH